ncbi:MAG: BamA/TamA family outer membrane protein [Candidatus Cloacimonetes bacterium]|jgi:outer membrane protein assembly factor BamA|nr:BamA/TamA family outer membrane protein [Candidatus Cloacimonadota bacterium]MCB5287384.1 BamA/TamA family outer membrane protein [Candidatus Cloacimonadota bacterium]MCK9184260.1 BamA/TamA family outer membrane protein [Candidatus Cloacimonadota bacterium]MCK9583825.1 BamA/TamA family outer membrane protein [Candidatus Cloacimonadota bacterium]MDY0229706.1 BamA/TamA family outer membrane protein [Candidatus Cloacimonadaceae bacterium]
MKVWALVLIINLMSLGLFALSITELSFEADFELDEAALISKSRIPLGSDYDPEIVNAAIQNLYQYFYEQDQYFIQIPRPELLALSEQDLRLMFHLTRLEDSSRIDIHYSGLKYFSESKLHDLAFTSASSSYPLSELNQIMQRVLSIYHQRGYLFASVQLDSLVLSDNLQAWLRISEEGKMQVQHYHFRGNKISRESSLLKSSGLLRQELLTPVILSQAEENIKAKPYIRDCTILPLDEQNLLIEIQEGRMTFLEGVLGLSEKDGKRELSGLVNIQFLNLWGSDRGISLYWRQTPADFSELNFAYHEAGHPLVPLAADFSLARTMQDSLWIQSSTMAEIYYHSLYQKAGFSVAARSILPGSSFSEVEKDKHSSIGAFWQYKNTRGDRIPSSGLNLGADYDYIFARGKNYGNLQLFAKNYLPLKNRFVGYLAAYLYSSENKDLPEYDLYTLGGYGSLRGYREDEFKSSKLGWINSELRYMIGPQSLLYIFYDQGFITQTSGQTKYDLIGIGTGIKLGTRLGILSIEYALGYRDTRFSDFGMGMIHLGIDIAL